MPDVKKLQKKEFLSIGEASRWASSYLERKVSNSNISYLLQYGKVKRHKENGNTLISKKELKRYYKSYHGKREINWKKKLGDDLNWALSFDHLREKDTTKHVHRLHPYKGKFIPQLVEYFLDDHTDDFKKDVYFKKGDIILDPFCGSGTALVQSNELGMYAVGIDISTFNATISNAKISRYDLVELKKTVSQITKKLNKFSADSRIPEFQTELKNELYEFNNKYFPTSDFRYKVSNNEINEKEYGHKKEEKFLKVFNRLVDKYNIQLNQNLDSDSFIDQWFIANTRKEIDFLFRLIKSIKKTKVKRILAVILSRAVRSCRATTHSDLATLKKPQLTTYYCRKHKKICKPLFSVRGKWKRYSKDTIRRLAWFDQFRTDTFQYCLTADSRNVNIFDEFKNKKEEFGNKLQKQKIDGIFTSPPYVGLIDYHEQHAYAYDLFGFERNDKKEIGPLFRGRGKEARESYKEGVAQVFSNSKKYLKEDYNVFIVANDKYNMYPQIAEMAGMEIVNKFKRPVLNRTEKDKGAYSEIIFHLKNK